LGSGTKNKNRGELGALLIKICVGQRNIFFAGFWQFTLDYLVNERLGTGDEHRPHSDCRAADENRYLFSEK